MADLRIVDAPEIPTENITGEEKLPTGGNGNYSISLDSLADYTKTKKDLVDTTSVDNKVGGVRQELDAHIEDLLNPHQVTKGQIGLGNVDNTADADKPVSNSAQAAIISAVAPKADKTYVDNQLTLKANKADVYTKSETYTKQESSDLVNNSISTALTPINTSLDLAKRGIENLYDPLLTYNSGERVVLINGDIVKSTVDGNVNNPNVNMTGWLSIWNVGEVETVADLIAIPNPKSGSRVIVKGYHVPANFALARPYKGGGWFIYNESKIGEHNGVTNFQGWIRQLDGYISPTFAGAKGDGNADERFTCELSIFYAGLLQCEWLVDTWETYYLNSYSNMSELPNYSARILPLLTGVTYNIKGTLQIGSFFDDKDFLVFTDINSADPSTRTHQYDYCLTGGGTIDFSRAGTRKTTYKSRQAIYTQNSSRVVIENLTFRDGDTPNCITTALDGQDFTIRNCRFINLMGDNLANDDHSTIYGTARGTKVKDCYFEMNTVNGYLNACAVELHNSESYFKNSTVKKYRATHIIAAITVETPYIENIEVSGLIAEIYRNFSTLDIWTGATIYGAKIHDNIAITLDFPSVSDLTSAGFDPSVVYAGSSLCLTTNDGGAGYDLTSGNCYQVMYYDNLYENSRNDDVDNKFKSMVYMHKAVSLGVHFFNNTVNCKNIFKVNDNPSQTYNRFDIYGLIIDASNKFIGLSDAPFALKANSIKSSLIHLRMNQSNQINTLMSLDVLDVVKSELNTFIVDGSFAIDIPVNIVDTTYLLSKPSNKFSYYKTHGIYFTTANVGQATFYLENTKHAKIINRASINKDICFGDFIGNTTDSMLNAMCLNSSGQSGTFDARLQVSNI